MAALSALVRACQSLMFAVFNRPRGRRRCFRWGMHPLLFGRRALTFDRVSNRERGTTPRGRSPRSS